MIALFIVVLILLAGTAAFAGQNDVPTGAGRTEISADKERAVWWEGSLNEDGDIDWYSFDLEEPSNVMFALEKPADKEYFCSVYHDEEFEEPITDVKAGNAGEKFAGYTVVKLEPGRYYLRIWGAPGDFTEVKEDTYKYALEYPQGKGKSSSKEEEKKKEEEEKEEQQQPEQEQKEQEQKEQEQKEQEKKQQEKKPEEQQQQQQEPMKEPMELSEEEAERLLDAHDEEERMRREMKRMQAPQMDMKVEKDW